MNNKLVTCDWPNCNEQTDLILVMATEKYPIDHLICPQHKEAFYKDRNDAILGNRVIAKE